MSDFTPRYKPGHALTMTAGTGGVTGGQLVEVSGDMTVQTASAGSTAVVGQPGHDAPAGELVTVHLPGKTVTTAVAAATVTAGDRLQAAADGKVTPLGDEDDSAARVGLALEGASADESCRYLPA